MNIDIVPRLAVFLLAALVLYWAQNRVRMFWKPLRIFWLSLQWLATVSSHPNGQDSLVNAIGEMTHSIILSNFGNAPCVGVVTEINPRTVEYIPESLSIFHIQIDGKGEGSSSLNLQETDTLNYASLDGGTLEFEELLIESLNAGCPIYVIQVSNPKAVIHCFARASRRAMFRENRQYLFLPVLKEDSDIPESSSVKVENIFTMKEMDYMPDLVVARITLNMNQTKANTFDVDHAYTSCNNKSLTFCIRGNLKQRECPGNSASKIAANMSSEFKIELLTHSFTGPEASKNLLLDVWIPGADGCGGRFLNSADLFPDKTRDLKGKELTLITFHYPPFIILDFDSNPPVYDGIEFRVVRQFMRYINCTFRQVSQYWNILLSSRGYAIEGK
jgi:hypothetical protein